MTKKTNAHTHDSPHTRAHLTWKAVGSDIAVEQLLP